MVDWRPKHVAKNQIWILIDRIFTLLCRRKPHIIICLWNTIWCTPWKTYSVQCSTKLFWKQDTQHNITGRNTTHNVEHTCALRGPYKTRNTTQQERTQPTTSNTYTWALSGLYRVFSSETDKFRQHVLEIILSKNSNIIHGPIRLRYHNMGGNVYELPDQ
jgi:hypothetical protein